MCVIFIVTVSELSADISGGIYLFLIYMYFPSVHTAQHSGSFLAILEKYLFRTFCFISMRQKIVCGLKENVPEFTVCPATVAQSVI